MATYPVVSRKNSHRSPVALPAQRRFDVDLDREALPPLPLLDDDDLCVIDEEAIKAFADWEREQAPAVRRPIGRIATPP